MSLATVLPSMSHGQGTQQSPRACVFPLRKFSMTAASMLPSIREEEIIEVQCWPQAIQGNDTNPGNVKLSDLRPPVERRRLIAFL